MFTPQELAIALKAVGIDGSTLEGQACAGELLGVNVRTVRKWQAGKPCLSGAGEHYLTHLVATGLSVDEALEIRKAAEKKAARRRAHAKPIEARQ
jgi:phage terminase Nu1 subunit (DNA packaging protein)